MARYDENTPRGRNAADFFLTALTDKYPVSDKFLNGFIPRVRRIFEFDIKDNQRESLLKLAEESIVRQAETEALLNRAALMLDELSTVPEIDSIRSRRRRRVSKDLLIEEEFQEANTSSAS